MRRLYLAAIALTIVAFLAVSALLARVWSADGAERSAIASLVQAEARGDQHAVVARIQGCGQQLSCSSRVAGVVSALTRPGRVAILQLETSSGFSLTGTVGTARVAWNVGSSRPIVQCVRVRRAGDALHGLRIELLGLSARIKTDGDCSGVALI